MTKAQINSDFSKSKGLVFLEYVLLALCLCVIALRATFTESPATQSTALPANLSDSVYSLAISAVLVFSFIVWLVWSFCSRRFLYRFSLIEIGLCLFCVAAVVAGLAAANKRVAITSFVTMFAPILMAVLLVQILDSQSKIKLLLVVIAALGVVSTYQCAEQFFASNQIMIEQYEEAPQSLLEPLGIEAGTFVNMLFEHRLYSKDVRGFFTTGNSAGSFALLASFAAIALFLEKLKNRKYDASGTLRFVMSGLAVAVIIFGLILTKSKGAIIASLIAAVMLIVYFSFGNWLNTHKKAIVVLCLLVIIIGGGVIVLYGLTHDRLPGGNSMLVRWQYWQASVKMYADHWLAGIGPGNFAHFYPHYKSAEALETVADPHNFLLTVLTQYGPLGLVGFLAILLVPLWKVVFPYSTSLSPKIYPPEPSFRKLATAFVIVISVGLLLVRPIVMPVAVSGSLDVIIYVIFTLYVAPVVAFIVGFWLLTTPLHTTGNTQFTIRNTNITAAALFCAVVGVIIHNTIDFAIFEPGVFTAFCAIMACLIAAEFHRKNTKPFVLKPPIYAKVAVVIISVIIVWAYFNYCLIPVAKSTAKIRHAQQTVSAGRFEWASNLLAASAKDDSLSPAALSLNGRVYLQRYKTSVSKQADLLLRSEKCLLNAIERDRADFKNFERLTEVYNLLAETSTQQRDDWLNKAFDIAESAVERYPGSARLRIELAKIAEQLGKTDIAIEQYKKAIDIEDSYRNQFRQMYPGREMFSRLGKEKYKFAKQQIKALCE